jgi:hypothetical protein
MMSEDMFFNKVKETMHGYSPEVSTGVYGAMRKKYARSKFFSWNASTLNVWYLALVAVLGVAVIGTSVDSNATASKASSINTKTEVLPVEISAKPEFIVTETKACERSVKVLDQSKGESCLFPSSLVEVKEEKPSYPEVVTLPSSSEIAASEEQVIATELIEVALPVTEEKQEVAPKKPTRRIKASVYKDKQ